MNVVVIITILVIAFLGGLVVALVSQNQRILRFMGKDTERAEITKKASDGPKLKSESANRIMVDTSAIIDGRIADIVETGFINGILYVPRFVLAELQNIADSEESIRRGRGRRGLEVLNHIRTSSLVKVEILEDDPEDIREVDAKLVKMAKKYHAAILTTDYNLNRVATIENVLVLNINELANAIKPVVLPGEEMVVKVVQAGKEKHQGVGYLADGTMIVVENGDKLIGREIKVEVTRIFQTVAGKMIFAAQKNGAKPHEQKTNHKPAQAHNKH